jgi:hypothetical protein
MLAQLLVAEGFDVVTTVPITLASQVVDRVADSESDIVVIFRDAATPTPRQPAPLEAASQPISGSSYCRRLLDQLRQEGWPALARERRRKQSCDDAREAVSLVRTMAVQRISQQKPPSNHCSKNSERRGLSPLSLPARNRR